jgi:uncharacterized protein
MTHPAHEHERAPASRHVPWPGLWRSQDVTIVLITLGAMVLIQAYLISTARAPARYNGLNGLAFAIFPTFITAAGVAVRARLRGLTAADLGLVRPRTWRPVVIAWLVAISAGPLTHFGSALLASSSTTTSELILAPLSAPRSGLGGIALFALVIAVLVPIVEEVIFRGLVHRTVRTRWPLVPSAILSGIVFAAVHLDATTLVPLFMVGFVFAWSYERSGSLWGSIVPHGGLNALTLLAVLTNR